VITKTSGVVDVLSSMFKENPSLKTKGKFRLSSLVSTLNTVSEYAGQNLSLQSFTHNSPPRAGIIVASAACIHIWFLHCKVDGWAPWSFTGSEAS
jgi:hypothetical protein